MTAITEVASAGHKGVMRAVAQWAGVCAGAACEPAVSRAVVPRTFDGLYDAHVDAVCRTLRRLGVDDHDLEDAAQDVFLAVYRKLGDFEGKSSLSTWIYAFAAHTARRRRRYARRHPEHTVDKDVFALELSGTGQAENDVHAALLLRRLLDTLDQDKREAFVLAELEGLTIPEIASALGVNVNTMYARVRAARMSMIRTLGEDAMEEGR